MTTGWRFWGVLDGMLVSPYQSALLPLSGTVSARCDHPHAVPHLSCLCGVAYYASVEDMKSAADVLGLLDDPVIAVTEGTVHGRVVADLPRAVAVGAGSMGWRVVRVPQAWRCESYSVLKVYTDQTHDYHLPTYSIAEL